MSSWVSLGIERLQELAPEQVHAAGDEGTDRRGTAPEDLRDRVLRQVFVVAEDDRGALAFREAPERHDDGLSIDQLMFGRWDRLRRGRPGQEPTLDRPSPVMVLREVDDRATEVGVEGARIAQVTEAPDDPDERVLGEAVQRDPEQVRGGIVDAVDAIPALSELQERVLHQLLGVLAARGHEVQGAEEALALPVEELVEPGRHRRPVLARQRHRVVPSLVHDPWTHDRLASFMATTRRA
jgi:hypothetical protein